MYISEDIEFKSNNEKLVGTLYKPVGFQHYKVVVVLHGSHMGARSDSFYDHLRELLPQYGVALFLYDRRGTGDSSGNFDTASFIDLAEDAKAAVEALQSREDITECGLYGISQGAWVASLAATLVDDLSFLIMVSGSGVTPAEQMMYAASVAIEKAGFSRDLVNKALTLKKLEDDYYREKVDKDFVESLLKNDMNEGWYSYAYLPTEGVLPADIKREKWYYQLDYNPLQCFDTIFCPVLFIFADQDIYVPVEISINMFKAVTIKNQKVRFETIEESDHFMNDIKGNRKSQLYLDLLTEWLMSSHKE